MRLYFKHVVVSPSGRYPMFTISVLPEEMEDFKKFISQYCDLEDSDYFGAGAAIRRAERELEQK